MEVTQTKRLGKDKPNSLFTFQRENFWREEQERREEPERKPLHKFQETGTKRRARICRQLYQQNGTISNAVVQH